MIDEAGFRREIRWLLLAGGIIAIHSATKAQMTRSSVPPPVTAVMDAASAWLPRTDGPDGRGAARRRLGRLRPLAWAKEGRGHPDGPGASGCGRSWS